MRAIRFVAEAKRRFLPLQVRDIARGEAASCRLKVCSLEDYAGKIVILYLVAVAALAISAARTDSPERYRVHDDRADASGYAGVVVLFQLG